MKTPALIKQIKSACRPPVFPDKKTTIRARAINAITLWGMLLSLIYFTFELPGIMVNNFKALLAVWLIASLLAGQLILRTGRVTMAAMVVTHSFWWRNTIGGLFLGGTHTAGTIVTYFIAILFSVLSTGKKNAFAVTFLSVTSVLISYFAEIHGWLPAPAFELGHIGIVFSNAFYFIIIYLMLYYHVNSLEDAIILSEKEIENREQTEHALRENESMLVEAQRVARMGHWHKDLESEKIIWSDEMFRITGLKKQEITSEFFLSIVHPADRDYIRQSLQNAYKKKISFEREYRICRPDRSIRWVKDIGKLNFDKEGHILHSYGILQDITEQKEIQDQLKHTEKMDAVGQLAGGIAHDFNNQLIGIMGFAELLKDKLDKDSDLQTYAAMILKSASRSADLTSKLLAYSRKGKYSSKLADVHEAIDEIISLLTYTLPKNIKINKELNAGQTIIKGDLNQLHNIFLNIAVNARDAMPMGGELTFSSRLTDSNGAKRTEVPRPDDGDIYIEISMRDTGVGMDKKILDRIFEPFFTTKEAEKGTGMGLASVYGASKNLNATIHVESEVDKGSVFSFCFPLVHDTIPQKPPGKTDRNPSVEARILFLDDEEIVLVPIKEMLSSSGYKVFAFSKPQEALSYYRDNWKQTDLVMLDMVMPEMNGLQVYQKMKEINPEIRVLFCSGYTPDKTYQKILTDGSTSYIQKPFVKAQLIDKITNVLGKASNSTSKERKAEDGI